MSRYRIYRGVESLEDRRLLTGDGLAITEFMASNSEGITDAFGDTSDWIELHNASDSAIDLADWSLTDDFEQPAKWKFTSGILAADARLIVWASGRDTIDSDGSHHTNFKLRAGGEYLALADPSGTLVTSFGTADTEYPPQESDVSYGVDTDAKEGFFREPTPGEPNGVSFLGFVADTTFTVDRGFFEERFSVVVATATPHATLVYTLDGTPPDLSNGTQVVGDETGTSSTIEISTTSTLRAIAFRDGWEPTNIDTQTYLFADHVIRQNGDGLPNNWGHADADYEMDPDIVEDPQYADQIVDGLKSLPSLSLVTDLDNFFGQREGIYLSGQGDPRPVSAELILADGTEGFQVDGSVEIQGGSSTNRWKSDKLSMQLKFKREYGDAKLEYPLYGEDNATEFDILTIDARLNQAWHYGGGVQPTSQRARAQYTRDQFVADLQNRMGGHAPNGQWIHVYLNGIYWGIHNLHERPDEHFASAYLGGDEDDYDVIKHNDDVVNGSSRNYRDLLALINSDTRQTEVYESVVDTLEVDQLIDYVLLNYYVGNTDWAHHNWYASYNKASGTGKWRFHSWDAEHVMKNLADDATGRDDAMGPTHIHHRLMRNDVYERKFHDAVQKHFYGNGQFTPAAASEVYQRRLDQVYMAIVPESARWGDNQRTRPYTRDREWVRERDRLMERWFPERTETVLQQLRNSRLFHRYDAPQLQVDGNATFGGQFSSAQTITIDSEGDVFYTLDGSDPADSPTRQSYDAGFTIDDNTTVRVRALRDGTEWSALVEANFLIGVPGDFNGNATIEADDLDLLHAAIAAASQQPEFDLDESGIVDVDDANHWITEIANTRRGDFNLDGEVGFNDFLELSGNFGKVDATWSAGDATGDGLVDFDDFLILSSEFGFSRDSTD